MNVPWMWQTAMINAGMNSSSTKTIAINLVIFLVKYGSASQSRSVKSITLGLKHGQPISEMD